MSYTPISVKEAVSRINASDDGWYLPSIQRPYVWGSRYEHDKYICRLFDSLLRGYPIGALILWKAETKVAFREFLRDYKTGQNPEKNAHETQWGRHDKSLVYDGQQRLQTLYSCLRYRYNDKVLAFNLLFDYKADGSDSDNLGFLFIPKDKLPDAEPYKVSMLELFSQPINQKVQFRRTLFSRCKGLTEAQEKLIEENLDDLWSIFVQTDKKSLAFYSVAHNDSSKVNEIFERLNTGGIPLTQADLLFSQLKHTHPDFEEKLAEFSDDIFYETGHGYRFTPYDILQVLFLLVKGTTRVDPDQLSTKDEKEYLFSLSDKLKEPLQSFFTNYMYGQFRINHNSIVPRQLALLPIIVYFYEIYQKGINFRKLPSEYLGDVNKYFVLSQINDWNTQGIVDTAVRLVRQTSKDSEAAFPFPLTGIQQIAAQKMRPINFAEDTFTDYTWFALKMLTPSRVYHFPKETEKRFKPQIDHIFPQKLDKQAQEYYETVDIVWNMQPVDWELNNHKRKRHPKEYFLNEGQKYFSEYDHLPSQNLNDAIWESPLEFIKSRRTIMIDFLQQKYGLEFGR